MLLRHAKTERAEAGQRDRDRKLMKRGRNDAPVIGAYMAHHSFVPDLTRVSPAARAQETWALVAPCFAEAPRTVTDDRIYYRTTVEPGIVVVTGPAGRGMTLAPAIAEETWEELTS